MSSQPDPTSSSAAPIANFSQCHAGIVAELDRLDRLPALLGPAAQVRQIASHALGFFRAAAFEHHAEEERELFPAVLASATKGEEHEKVAAIVDQLTREHCQIEAIWKQLEPALKSIAKGQDSHMPADEVAAMVASLVTDYRGHAHFEEVYFLPLSQTILGRNSDHMAALGLSLHTRHAMADMGSLGGFHV
jgi:iron-sulfur cluster repair protein YtfE (RIC family)